MLYDRDLFDQDCQQAYYAYLKDRKEKIRDGSFNEYELEYCNIKGFLNISWVYRRDVLTRYSEDLAEANTILYKWEQRASSELSDFYHEHERDVNRRKTQEEADARRKNEEKKQREEIERVQREEEAQERKRRAEEERRRKAVEEERRREAERERLRLEKKKRESQEQKNKDDLKRLKEVWQNAAPSLPPFDLKEFLAARREAYAHRRLPEIEKEVSQLRAQEKERIEAEERALREKAERERQIAEEKARKIEEERRKAEEEKRRKEEEKARKKAEEEKRKAIEASTDYEIVVDKIADRIQAMMSARTIFGWGSADFRKNLETMPASISRVRGKIDAEELASKLNCSGFSCHIEETK